MTKLIPIAKPQILKSDVNLASKAIKDGWDHKHVFYVDKFERKFKQKVSAKYAIATSSCTGALTLALASLKLKRGSEVILSNLNWIATVSPVVTLGYKPIFCDVDLKNWCISIEQIKKKITSKTKVVIFTHLYGNLCEISKIKKYLKKKNIYIIEDAAEALGSKINGLYAGTFGDFGCFSFHASKAITTGEGGMLITNNSKLNRVAKKLSNHGRSKKNYKAYFADEIGYKFKMTNFQAAMGISQIRRLDKIIKRKRQIFNYYKKNINHDFINFNFEEKGLRNSYWLTSVFVVNENFNLKKFQNYMLAKGVDVRNFFPPLSTLPMFKKKESFKNSKKLFENSFNIPSHISLTKAEQNKIINLINNYFERL